VLRDGKFSTGTSSCGTHRFGIGLLRCFNCQHPNLQTHKWSTHPVHNHLAHVTVPLAHSLSSIVVPLACIQSTVQPLVIFAPHHIRRFFCGHDCIGFGSNQVHTQAQVGVRYVLSALLSLPNLRRPQAGSWPGCSGVDRVGTCGWQGPALPLPRLH
jgi:hypothetical protein